MTAVSRATSLDIWFRLEMPVERAMDGPLKPTCSQCRMDTMTTGWSRPTGASPWNAWFPVTVPGQHHVSPHGPRRRVQDSWKEQLPMVGWLTDENKDAGQATPGEAGIADAVKGARSSSPRPMGSDGRADGG